MRLSESDKIHDESPEISVPSQPGPVHPAGRIIRRVGVVVAALRVPELIARIEKRDPLCQENIGERIPDLLFPEIDDVLFLCLPLDAAVPAEVLGGSVIIVLAVCVIVLFIVRDKVGERKSVHVRDVIDAPH